MLIKESLKENKNSKKILIKSFYPKLMSLAKAES